ncbi:pyridoxamine 5'-phosphate oxidase family protein [Dysosmobacter sp.]|uniref:pyridoxamine 5'-phosphate oxidase family protein n=1 Tax=Dysosmobacter sp. TaxID=2591382 RepID=UPI003A8DAF44
MSDTPYYTDVAFRAAERYWDEKDVDSVKLDRARLQAMIEDYIQRNNTCALATGTGDYVRCTPIEYSYHDGCFWMFSEGGKKFIGLARNANVCLAIFDKYEGFGKLHGMQVMGKAELVEPFNETYNAHAAFKKIPLAALQKLSSPMHLICVHPTRIDCLFSDFKELGCAPRQTLVLEEA